MNLIIFAPKLPGIYSVTNIITGKAYIGSTNNIHKRLNSHRTSLLAGTFCNKALQRDFDKLGKSAFILDIVEFVNGSDSELAERESHFTTQAHKSSGGCYNRVKAVPRRPVRPPKPLEEKYRHRNITLPPATDDRLIQWSIDTDNDISALINRLVIDFFRKEFE